MSTEEAPFRDTLTEALSQKADYLERTSVASLREKIRGFEASFGAIYKFLIEKGLLQDDPYRQERSVTEIQIPSSDPYAESDRSVELSMRLSQYAAQWEFLVSMFHISLVNMSLKTIKRLLDLLDYIRWTDFSVNSSYQITRAVANMLAKLSQLNDPMAGKVISSEAAQLRERSKEIKADLRNITAFLKERYKYRIRDDLITGMHIDAEAYRRSSYEVLQNVKFEFTHRLQGQAWYKELIQEILEEDYGSRSEEKREAVLERLSVKTSVRTKKAKKGPTEKMQLLGILDHMSRASEPIRSALVKMNENARVIHDRKKSFGERVRQMFSNMFRKHNPDIIYEIVLNDPGSGVSRRETINYTRFSEVTAKKARLLQDLQDRNSATHKRSRASTEDQLQEFILKNIQDLKNIHRTLSGLDSYFRSDEIPGDIVGQMKGCSLNIKGLKSQIADFIRDVHDFQAQAEEAAQLRKLGIED